MSPDDALARLIWRTNAGCGSRGRAPVVGLAVESRPATRVDRVHFAEFGASEYVFEFVYYVLSPDYNVYMDTQEAINVAIVEAFEREGIEFAYPTRTIILAPTDRPVAAT